MVTRLRRPLLALSLFVCASVAQAVPPGGVDPPVCSPPSSRCGFTCRNLNNDPMNCGACGAVCGPGKRCQSRKCVTSVSASPSCQRSGGGYTWSCAGPVAGQACVQIHEDADPDTWGDNYLCHAGSNELQWSQAGPINGMTCTAVREDAEPPAHAWSDNYLCAPQSSRSVYAWSMAGPLSGWSCVQWLEPADPHTWSDNYLCVRPKTKKPNGCPPGEMRCNCTQQCAPIAACAHICN